MNDINIPPDSRIDPDAPFNEIDYGDCDYCENGVLGYHEEYNEYDYCTFCDGTGKLTSQQVQDAYESYLEDMHERN